MTCEQCKINYTVTLALAPGNGLGPYRLCRVCWLDGVRSDGTTRKKARK